MMQNKEKFELVFELHGLKSEHTIQIVKKLLNLLTSETRLLNDYVSSAEISYNQGKIAAYRELLEYIEQGIPVHRVS